MRINKRIVGLGLGAGIALGGAVSAVALTGGSAVPQTGPTTTLPCPGSGPNGPLACNNANVAASRAQAAKQWPVAGTYMSRNAAIYQIEAYTGGSGYRAHAVRTTYANASVMLHQSGNPSVNPDTEVWVVTLVAPADRPFTVSGAASAPPLPVDLLQRHHRCRERLGDRRLHRLRCRHERVGGPHGHRRRAISGPSAAASAARAWDSATPGVVIGRVPTTRRALDSGTSRSSRPRGCAGFPQARSAVRKDPFTRPFLCHGGRGPGPL